MSTTLYFTKANDDNLLQILVAAKYLRIDLATQEINKKYDPLTLVTPEGSLNQPNTILQYLCNGKMSGQTEMEKLQVWEWFEHLNIELHPLLRQIYEQISNERPRNREKYEYSVKQLLRELDLINNHLKIRTFMVGNTATSIDISLATHLQTAFRLVVDDNMRRKLPNLMRWFVFMRQSEPFKQVLGEVCLWQKELDLFVELPKKEEAKEKSTEETKAENKEQVKA